MLGEMLYLKCFEFNLMKTHSIVGVSFIIVIFLVLVYWLFLSPKLNTPKIALEGEVVSIKKMKRSGDYLLEVRQGAETKLIWYTFFKEQADICIGDSLFKKPHGKLLVRCKDDAVLRLAKDQDIIISR
jgi:hypothetical protein